MQYLCDFGKEKKFFGRWGVVYLHIFEKWKSDLNKGVDAFMIIELLAVLKPKKEGLDCVLVKKEICKLLKILLNQKKK